MVRHCEEAREHQSVAVAALLVHAHELLEVVSPELDGAHLAVLILDVHEVASSSGLLHERDAEKIVVEDLARLKALLALLLLDLRNG